MYSLNFARTFRDDAQSAVNYIRHALKNPVAAQKLKDDIKKAYKKIKETPFIYPVVTNDYLAAMGLRFSPVKNYLLFYAVEGKQIHIVRFLYGHRDWINILKDAGV